MTDEDILKAEEELEQAEFITVNQIKKAIISLVKENEMLQDKVYKLEDIIKEVREYIYKNSFDEERKEIIDELWVNEIKDILEILDKGELND